MTLGEQRALFGIPLLWPGWGLGGELPFHQAVWTHHPDQWLWAWVFRFYFCLGFFSPPKRSKEGGDGSFKNEKEAPEAYKPT